MGGFPKTYPLDPPQAVEREIEGRVKEGMIVVVILLRLYSYATEYRLFQFENET